jgi:rare lipoprotein A (peptidoglycan hydrolase)
VAGRIVDLSSSTAQKIGITQQTGTATVTVAPISVPLPDGSTKSGAATLDAKP